ncbi:MAG: hypothetical protein Q8S73_12460 [Deltaproteobacteria bacterium]|nr:hypothetical protein [Deltaproteobacteria bacterium]
MPDEPIHPGVHLDNVAALAQVFIGLLSIAADAEESIATRSG